MLFVGCNDRDMHGVTARADSPVTATQPLGSLPDVAASGRTVVSDRPAWNSVNGRHSLAVEPELVWTQHTSGSDTSAMQPIGIIATDSLLLVSDYAAPRIVARSIRDGNIEWMAGRRGSGPGEWSGILQFARADNREIVVFERQWRRLATVTTSGRILSSRQLRAYGSPTSVCVDDQGLGVVGVIGQHFSHGLLDRGGDSIRLAPEQPWIELQQRNGVAGQFRATYLAGYGCTLAPSYMSRIMRIGADGSLQDSIQLIEEIGAPAETTGGSATRIMQSVRAYQAHGAQGVARAGDFITVPFGGTSKWKGRLIDAYDVDSGRYSGTFTVEGRVMDIAGNRTHAFVLFEREDGEYEIAAYRIGANSKK